MGYQYGTIIITDHAEDRMRERQVSLAQVVETIEHPDVALPRGYKTQEFIRMIDQHEVRVVAASNKQRDWVVISCWADPPMLQQP